MRVPSIGMAKADFPKRRAVDAGGTGRVVAELGGLAQTLPMQEVAGDGGVAFPMRIAPDLKILAMCCQPFQHHTVDHRAALS